MKDLQLMEHYVWQHAEQRCLCVVQYDISKLPAIRQPNTQAAKGRWQGREERKTSADYTLDMPSRLRMSGVSACRA
ncbi:hypothetical protein [Parvibium lacunae]|uniref:Uncharacterized protein n=1 Tax=Parvibium lacunae TaxID=1888893 RepID=A0A368L1P7_9BURK|nr:hypothetical protein [Parvibium lacunae]RCS57474.1 hypothetical protein DU000_08460 [Parvibium lacunae]